MGPRSYLILIFLLVISSYFVEATGISGGSLLKNKELFIPGGVYEFGYVGIPDSRRVNSYEVYATNDLAEYVTFNTPIRYEDQAPGEGFPISGQVNFPDSLPPGMAYVYICTREDCAGGGNSCGRTAACAQLGFIVLHDGIYPVVGMFAPNINQGDTAEILVNVKNLGKEEIRQATGKVDIYDLRNELVGSVDLKPVSVESNGDAAMPAPFDSKDLPPGNYTAYAIIDADGISAGTNRTFRIGDLSVLISNYTTELKRGGIQQFVVETESEWNDLIRIYADVMINTDKGTLLASATTATEDLQPWKSVKLKAFIDTSGTEPGEYPISIVAHFNGYDKTVEGTVRIVEAEGEAAPVDEKVPEDEQAGISMTTLTIILVSVVVLLTIVNVFLAMRRRKD